MTLSERLPQSFASGFTLWKEDSIKERIMNLNPLVKHVGRRHAKINNDHLSTRLHYFQSYWNKHYEKEKNVKRCCHIHTLSFVCMTATYVNNDLPMQERRERKLPGSMKTRTAIAKSFLAPILSNSFMRHITYKIIDKTTKLPTPDYWLTSINVTRLIFEHYLMKVSVIKKNPLYRSRFKTKKHTY